MKKIFYLIFVLSFIANTVICQNIDNQNKGIQNNPPVNIQNNDNLSEAIQNNPQLYNQNIPAPNQQLVMNNSQQDAFPQQGQEEFFFPQQKSNDNIISVSPTVNIGTLNHNQRTYVSYTSSGSSSKKHYKKNKINLHKIHILRKFRNECPLFKAKTYKKLFTSKKHRITHCFSF